MVRAAEPRGTVTDLRPIDAGSPDYRRWFDIYADAYPALGLDTAAQRDAACRASASDESSWSGQRLIGAYRDGVLVGGLRQFDFSMCVRGAQVTTAGIGSVAVSLEHRRRGVARDLLGGVLAAMRSADVSMAVLHAYRPDFYGRMGFGFGGKSNRYRLRPEALPADGARERVRALGPGDADALLAAYNRIAARTNGLIRHDSRRVAARFARSELRTYAYFEGPQIAGYALVEVRLGKRGTINRNELVVHELLCACPAALRGLFAFLRSWRDGIGTIVVETSDPDFHFAVLDPRNGSDRVWGLATSHETNVQGVGCMYRVVEVRRLFDELASRSFGELHATVRLDVADPFVAANTGSYALTFAGGRPQVSARGPADVDLAIGIGDLAALIMGAVRLRSLVAYGRATLSEPQWLARLDAAFDTEPPQCLTRF